MLALREGNSSIAESLMSAKADVNAASKVCIEYNDLSMASSCAWALSVEFLLTESS
jgi:hypothetical protein